MGQVSKCLKVSLVDLDGQTVPDWVRESLDQEGIDFVVRDCKTREELSAYAGDAEVVWLFGGSRVLLGGNLAAVPRCRAILRTGSGTDNVPVEEATRRQILVANTPAAISDGVSDHLIALLFAVTRRVTELDRAVRLGKWKQTPFRPLNAVQGRTLGLVGFGHIARDVVRKLSGFEMRVLAHDPYVGAETMAAHGVTAISFRDLLAESDYVSLHVPLTTETRHLIGERELRLMKPTAILLNTSRGPVIDEAALVRALREGWIAAAGLDVLENEPPAPDNSLLELDNVVLTPHIAGACANGVEIRWRLSVETVLALARRQAPRSLVNGELRSSILLREASVVNGERRAGGTSTAGPLPVQPKPAS
ncbi:MAG: C-terminal binding protein [Planctomycetes bacterium]|nr:C-terminal binding protein [Planctomycetota bacterium]